jgi:hypothetical protein
MKRNIGKKNALTFSLIITIHLRHTQFQPGGERMKKIFGITISVVSILIMVLVHTESFSKNVGDKCNMDIECGVGKKCVNGVCTGGMYKQIKGKCVRGKFGKKVCTNTGKDCFSDNDCWK